MAMIELSNYVKSVKNLILPLLNGEDHICRCLCAREQAHHVVSYNEAPIEVYTDNVIPVVAGVVVGVFIFWSLLWLVVILKLFIDGRCLLRKPKSRNTKDSLILRCVQNMEDVSEDGAGADSDVLNDDQSNNVE